MPSEPTSDAAAYDAWYRAKVQKAMDDPPPGISHEQVEVYSAEQRAAALRKAKAMQERPASND